MGKVQHFKLLPVHVLDFLSLPDSPICVLSSEQEERSLPCSIEGMHLSTTTQNPHTYTDRAGMLFGGPIPSRCPNFPPSLQPIPVRAFKGRGILLKTDTDVHIGVCPNILVFVLLRTSDMDRLNACVLQSYCPECMGTTAHSVLHMRSQYGHVRMETIPCPQKYTKR